MSFCTNCGKELSQDAAFCSNCGKAAAPSVTAVVPVNNVSDEEQTFLDLTHRLLRWERKAWSIAGKVYLILGIVFAAIFFLLGVVFLAMDDYFGITFGTMYIFYAFLYGGMFIALGIVNSKAADKIPFYLDSLYTNFRLTYDRCGSVGMLVFNAILGTVSPIFFIINFVRMKSNRALVEKILAQQKNT